MCRLKGSLIIRSIIGLLAVSIGLAAAALGPTDYNLRYLGRLSASGSSRAYGVNDSFTVVGEAVDGAGVPQAFAWDVSTSASGLALLPHTYPGARAWAISNSGVICGEQLENANLSHLCIWTPVDPTNIGAGYNLSVPSLSTSGRTARGIDDNGNIVGWEFVPATSNTDRAFARFSDGSIVYLPSVGLPPVPSRAYSVATATPGMPNAGTTYVAGAVFEAGIWKPARWVRPNGSSTFTLTILPMPGGLPNDGWAYGVNRAGHVVGEITLNGVRSGFVNSSTGTRLISSTGHSIARDINDTLRIVGEIETTPGTYEAAYADDPGVGSPVWHLVSLDPSSFGYRSGIPRQAFQVADVQTRFFTSGDYLPPVAMRADANSGGSHAVLARPKEDNNNSGRAIGGVAAVRMAQGAGNPGQSFLLQIVTSYLPPSTAIQLGDHQAEVIPGLLEFRLASTNETTTLGGNPGIPLSLQPGQDRAPADTGANSNVTLARNDAGKVVRVTAIISQAYLATNLSRDITVSPLTSQVVVPVGTIRAKLGESLSLSVNVRDTAYLLGLDSAQVFCELWNPVTFVRLLFDCTSNAPKIADANGNVTFSAAVPAEVGISMPGNPVRAIFTVAANTTGGDYPYYFAATAQKDLDLYSDTKVSVPDADAYPGETIPVTAVLSTADLGMPIAGRTLVFYRIQGNVEIGSATTSPNGIATILYPVPATSSGLPFLGNIPIVVRFAGDASYEPSESTGRIRVGFKGLKLENYVLSGITSEPQVSPPPLPTDLVFQGTLGEPIVGAPDSQEEVAVRVFNAFWHTFRRLIKRIQWGN